MEKIDNSILRYLHKTSSPEEQDFLLKWLEESEVNRQYFRSLKDAHDLGKLDIHLYNSQVDQQWIKFEKQIVCKNNKTGISRYFIRVMRYAAVFILGIICFQAIHYIHNQDEKKIFKTTIIETGVGERSKITLPDGSKIWLNACSSLAYDNTYGNIDRQVHIKGEGYFEVHTDTLKPFFVHADRFTYRVTGTSFNVYSFDDENETSIALLEGGVTIEYENLSEQLLPGQEFIFNKESGKYTLTNVDVNRLSSWREGELVFDNITFEELAKRLERNFNIQFVFENDNVRKHSFGGSFRNYESVETIMKVISTSTPVKYEIRENIVYVK
ncbi:sigma factor regulatory protein, FecR/PupR family [Proteiniphilum saccharofermentans]|uniref:Sigma factor regulatory protein, FecR/PupR family n=1 Tax=Proteiniphilum saccharofermentans TaxID=1642647 RepID=A0A1R3TAM0_9BACT|nr:FecR family protein [Proteiniphilum saccharofermentans]SCD21005.1 sigma factor regulatory protein, FecR/PupR family [Proteiniphilum saccharofermentans]SEA45954.1 FecR family protein [Porphyromonadaceae bacterium KH3R12]